MKIFKKKESILGVLVNDSIIDYFLNFNDCEFKTKWNLNIKDIDKLCTNKYGCDVYRYRLLGYDDPIIKVNFISPKRTVEFTCSVCNKQLKWNWLEMQYDWEYILTKVEITTSIKEM